MSGATSRAALYVVAVLGACATHWLMWDGSYAVFSASIDFNRGALEDFMGVYLPQARSLAEDPTALKGFLYSPAFALLLRPLAGLEPDVASWVWLVLQLGAVAALVVLGRRSVRGGPPLLGPLYVFVALTSLPLVHNLHWGQVSVFLALFVLLALRCEQSTRFGRAGAWLGCATAIKGYPALFVIPALLARRRRELAWAAGALLVLLAAPACILGPGATLEFYRSVYAELRAAQSSAWSDAPNMQYLPAVLGRWTRHAELLPVFFALGWLLAGWSVLAVARLVRGGQPEGVALAYALVALSLPLVVSPSWPHYFVLLPFAQLLVARLGWQDPLVRGSVLVSVLLSNALTFRLLDDPERYGALGLLLTADVVLLLGAQRCAVRWVPGRDASAQSSSPVA